MANPVQTGLRAMRIPVIALLALLALRTAYKLWQASFGPQTSALAASSADSSPAAEPAATAATPSRDVALPLETTPPSEELAVAATDSASRDNEPTSVSRDPTLTMDASALARKLGNVLAARSARFAHWGTNAGELLARLLRPSTRIARDGAAPAAGTPVGTTAASAASPSTPVAALGNANLGSELDAGLESRTPEITLGNPDATGFTIPAVSVPPPAAPPRALVLTNPPESGGTVYFLVDGRQFALSPGQSQTLPVGRPWRVHFDRGAEYGEIVYTLSEGAYAFAVTERGWDLVPQSPAP